MKALRVPLSSTEDVVFACHPNYIATMFSNSIKKERQIFAVLMPLGWCASDVLRSGRTFSQKGTFFDENI